MRGQRMDTPGGADSRQSRAVETLRRRGAARICERNPVLRSTIAHAEPERCACFPESEGGPLAERLAGYVNAAVRRRPSRLGGVPLFHDADSSRAGWVAPQQIALLPDGGKPRKMQKNWQFF
jgi:hypothetical protein